MEVILGIGVSLVIQTLKNVLKLGEYGTLAALFVLALAGAGIYTWLVDAGLWESVWQILVTAGAFYSFIIARFEPDSELSKSVGWQEDTE